MTQGSAQDFINGNNGTGDGARGIAGRSLAVFEDRYGAGAYERLTTLLQQPCVTFAEIASRFGVTRERVRQWHRRFLPDGPSGHMRQRLCALYQQRRRLFEDPLFRAFFRHARPHFSSGRIEPIRSRDGYCRQSVLVEKRLVALRDVSTSGAAPTVRYRGKADFIYLRLNPDEFPFVPAAAVPAYGVCLTAESSPSVAVFWNTFAAIRCDVTRRPRDGCVITRGESPSVDRDTDRPLLNVQSGHSDIAAGAHSDTTVAD